MGRPHLLLVALSLRMNAPVRPLPPPSSEKKVSVTVWLDPVLLKALKHEGIDRDMTVAELIEEALRVSRAGFTEHK